MDLKNDYDVSTAEGQKRLMYESMGLTHEGMVIRPWKPGDPDYGCDPLGDGTFRMVPSGDIVSWDERCKRLKR
jgi:hypothetical protein